MANRTYFSADTHFGHGRIIGYTNRPFDSSASMDETIVERFNRRLNPGDTLYHLGDVSWSSWGIRQNFLNRLVTREVHLILGNHDNRSVKEYLEMGFRSVSPYKVIALDRVKGSPDVQGSSQSVVLFHYPIRSWDGKSHGAFHLYGHSHGALEPSGDRSMDVGVDTHDFFPWSWEEVKGHLAGRPIYAEGEVRK